MQIEFSKDAVKFLKKQDKPTQHRIISSIKLLPSGDVRKLQGRNGYRLRIGSVRVIFNINGNIINIIDIGPRGQVYKK